MTRISFLYPHAQGVRFDFDYYVKEHMPWSISLLSTHRGFKGVSVERGMNSPADGGPPAYVAVCHFLFESFEDFMSAVSPNLAALQADMKNYTDLQPILQVSEVLISQ